MQNVEPLTRLYILKVDQGQDGEGGYCPDYFPDGERKATD